MNFIADLHRGAIRQQHPHRDLQPFSASINDRNCAVSPLRPAEDPKSRTIKRMERIENLDLGAFREQGIVGADVIIRMSTTSFQPVAWLSTVPDGSIPRAASSCPSTPSAASLDRKSTRLNSSHLGI